MSKPTRQTPSGIRGPAREQAILDATVALLHERGYQALTMDAVAARAQASKATIYRRWPGKPELVRAAMDAYGSARVREIPDTGSLRGDLLAAMQALREQATEQNLTLLQGLAQAMRYDARLAELLRAHVLDDDLTPFAPVLKRAGARGELSEKAPLTLIHEVGEALVFRQHSLGLPFDEAFCIHVIDDVLLPLLRS